MELDGQDGHLPSFLAKVIPGTKTQEKTKIQKKEPNNCTTGGPPVTLIFEPAQKNSVRGIYEVKSSHSSSNKD